MIRPDVRAQLHLTLPKVIAANGGTLPRATVKLLAESFQVSERSIYREAAALEERQMAPAGNATPVVVVDEQLTDDLPAEPVDGSGQPAEAADVPDDEHGTAATVKWWTSEAATRQVLTALGGASTVAAAWRDLRARGLCTVSYPTFTRQLKDHLDPAVHAGLTAQGTDKGRYAYVRSSLYCTEVTEGRNTRWQADVHEVPVRVRSNTGTRVSVWQITFLDEATRRVMGTMFTTAAPTGEDVKATLVAAVMGHTDVDGTYYGGLPDEVRWDNGREFVNDILTGVCAQLGIIPIPSPPHSGWHKGKVERFQRTMQQRFFSTLPGATQGPKTFTGKRPWRGADEDLLFFDSFVALSLNGVEEYNSVHVHSALGCTPNDAWRRDTAPIRRAPDAALHPLMLVLPRQRTVGKDGISYDSVKYVAPDLARWRRRKVEVRVLPHEVDQIFVFDPKTGALICRATPAARLTPAQRQRLLRKRSEDYAAIRTAIQAGTERRNTDATIAAVLQTERDLATAAKKNNSNTAADGPSEPATPGTTRRRRTKTDTDANADPAAGQQNALDANTDDFLDLFGDDT